MARYASGEFAYFISDRSGFRYPYRDMKIEWTGAAVGPDEFEPAVRTCTTCSRPPGSAKCKT